MLGTVLGPSHDKPMLPRAQGQTHTPMGRVR